MADFKLTSQNQFLDEFMKKEFKEQWKDVLSEQLKKLKVDNIINAEDESKRIFVENVLSIMNVSAQKKEVYNAELKKILGIKTSAQKDTYVTQNKKELSLLEKPYEQIKEELFNAVKKEIDGGYYKIESVFNLFWLKAIEAELKGAKHEKVMQIMKESLNIVRNDVNLVFLRFEDEAELNKELFKLLKTINKYVTINPPNSFRNEKRKQVADLIYDTKKKFNAGYDNFVNTFLKTISDQVQLKTTGRSDFYLVNSSRETALKTWEKIKNSYEVMSGSFKNLYYHN